MLSEPGLFSPSAVPLLEGSYDELRKIARNCLRNERPGHTLQPTALVHEALLRVADTLPAELTREHFMRLVALAMRRVTIDHARAKLRLKRGSREIRSGLDGLENLPSPQDESLLRLADALRRLAEVDPLKASVVDLHFFAGFTVEETADALHCSTATVSRHWRTARAWLLQELDAKP